MAKINIVFEARERSGAPEHVFVEVETLDGHSIKAGEWNKDIERKVDLLTIDLEALNKDLTPTVEGLVPYFSYEAYYGDYHPFPIAIRKRPVWSVNEKGNKTISMGFVVALVYDEPAAKIMTEVMNAAFPPNPNEPKDE